MSVYTIITKEELENFLQTYSLGKLISFSGISEGVTNTIYKISTTAGDFVLTLFEDLNIDELPFFINLVDYLNVQSLNCTTVIANNDKKKINLFKNKATIISQFLPGNTLTRPSIKQTLRAMES